MPKYRTTFRTVTGEPFAPLHVQAMIDRTGKLRTYWRGPGDRCAINGARLLRMVPNAEQPTWIVDASAKWWDQYFALRHGTPLPVEDGVEPVIEKGGLIVGSWDQLIALYKTDNTGWLAMGKSTRDGYVPYQNTISRILGSHKVAKTEARHVKDLITKKQFGDPNATQEKERQPLPMAAKMLRTVFGLLYEHARLELRWIEINPVRDIKKPKSANKDGHHTLTEAEVDALRRAHPDYASDERAFLEIGIAWGARASDLCGLGFKNIAADFVTFKPEKTQNSTGAVVTLPVAGEHLLAVFDARSQTDKFFFQQPPKGSNQYNRHKLVDLNPRCWDYTRARKMWQEMRERAGIGDDAVIHSMRKLFATRMAEAGTSLTDIADALGDTEESAKIYVAKRNKKAGAARAFNAALAAA
jgi:integrase